MKRILKGLGVSVLSVVMVGIFSLSVTAQAPTGRKYKANGSIKLDMGKFDGKGSLGGFSWNGENKNTDFETTVSFGFFLNDMFEIGPEFSYSSSKEEEEDIEAVGGSRDAENETTEITMWTLGVKANAHFNLNGSVIPYVGLRLALASFGVESNWNEIETQNGVVVYSGSGVEMDDSDISILYGFQLGLDYFLTSHVSINPELRYSMASFKLKEPDGFKIDFDYDETSLMIGISVHF